MRQVIVALLVAGLAAGPAYARTRAATAVAQPAAGAVEAEIRRLSASIGGAVGVAAWRLDGRGPRVVVNGAERFPMASTFKVAVAGAILKKVDDGALTLDQMIAVPPSLMVPSEVLADRFIHPGVSLSVHNLLELMLTQSDNSATDVLVAAAGGPAGVTAWVRAQGVDDLRIDRDTAGLLRDFFRLPPGPLGPAFEAAAKADPALESSGGRPNPAFDDDPRDSSTPQAMAKLLERIFGGHALRPASTQALIAIMERCRTGTARLRGRLPTGVTVADKTGTIGGSVNDVGVITLPDGAGQLVVAVFIKKSDAPFDARERVIADIGRSLYDFYLFQGDR